MATGISYKNIEYLESLKNSKKPGLDNLLKVLQLLGEPQSKLKKTIIVSPYTKSINIDLLTKFLLMED